MTRYGYHLRENIKKQLLNAGRDCLKAASKKVVHKTGELIRNKIADAVIKSKDDNTKKKEPVEEIIIPLEKKMKY